MFPSLVFILGSIYIVRGRTRPTDWTLHPLTQIAQLHERSRTWRSVADSYHSTCKRQGRMRTVDWQKEAPNTMSGFWAKGFEGIGCAWVQEVEVDWKQGMSLQGGDSEHWPKLLMLQCPLLYFLQLPFPIDIGHPLTYFVHLFLYFHWHFFLTVQILVS